MYTIIIQAVFWTVSIAVIAFAATILVWTLAKNNLFWTIMEEGQARATLVNGAFCCFFMSYKNKIFAKEDLVVYHSNSALQKKMYKMNNSRKNTALRKIDKKRKKQGNRYVKEVNHPWDIVSDVRSTAKKRLFFILPGFLVGIRWIGIPPFAQIYSYRFRWTSIEEKADKEKEQTRKVAYTTDKVINYINLKPDIFLITVTAAETNELLPLDIKLAITLQIINPYKALYDAEKWLENVESQVGAKVRKHVGTLSYEQLIKAETKSKSKIVSGKESLLSNEVLEYILDSIRENYGVDISRVQILDVNPGSEQAKEFVSAATVKFVKERKAEGDIKETEGLKAKYGEIAKHRGGPEMYIMEQIKDSKLRAFSSGGGPGLLSTVQVEDTTKDDEEKNGGEEK